MSARVRLEDAIKALEAEARTEVKLEGSCYDYTKEPVVYLEDAILALAALGGAEWTEETLAEAIFDEIDGKTADDPPTRWHVACSAARIALRPAPKGETCATCGGTGTQTCVHDGIELERACPACTWPATEEKS